LVLRQVRRLEQGRSVRLLGSLQRCQRVLLLPQVRPWVLEHQIVVGYLGELASCSTTLAVKTKKSLRGWCVGYPFLPK
jgi:hypothetical protein